MNFKANDKKFVTKENQHKQQIANEHQTMGQFNKHFNRSMIKKINMVLFLTWQPYSNGRPSLLTIIAKNWQHTHTYTATTWRLQRISNNRQIMKGSKKLEK